MRRPVAAACAILTTSVLGMTAPALSAPPGSSTACSTAAQARAASDVPNPAWPGYPHAGNAFPPGHTYSANMAMCPAVPDGPRDRGAGSALARVAPHGPHGGALRDVQLLVHGEAIPGVERDVLLLRRLEVDTLAGRRSQRSSTGASSDAPTPLPCHSGSVPSICRYQWGSVGWWRSKKRRPGAHRSRRRRMRRAMVQPIRALACQPSGKVPGGFRMPPAAVTRWCTPRRAAGPHA